VLLSGYLPKPRRQNCINRCGVRPAAGTNHRGLGVIDPTPLGIGRQNYYLQKIAHDREAYLSGDGEAPGYVLGSAAAALGLSGEVSAEAFERLFAGCHPASGALLGRVHRSGGNLAWDLVFRPTKSLSLLYGMGSREQSAAARAAHHAGVQAAVEKLETYAAVRRGRNGVERHAASGLLVVGFDHRASRPGDPLLHTHAIVMNRAQGSDGRWTALDARPMLAALMEADAVYRATYQRHLTERLGLEWEPPDEHGNCELAGIPEEVIRHFSKAAARIDEECAAREQRGEKVTPAVRNMLAHKLREDKCHETLSGLRGRWAAEAGDNGWDLPGLFERLRGRVRTADELDADAAAVIFDRLAGSDGLTAQMSTFTRGRVLREIAGQPEATTLPVAELEGLADRFVAERAVPTLVDCRSGAQRYSTPELLALEQRIVESTKARVDEDRHVVSRRVVAAVIDRYADLGSPLGDDQAEALRAVCGGGGVLPIVGRAGTGKTFLMDAVRSAFETANLLLLPKQRFRVRGLAPTGIAAIQLHAGAGVESATVDRFLVDLDNRRDRLEAGDVVLLDEAGMVGTRTFARLLDHANQVGAKLVPVGDDRQLQSIDVGGWFRGLKSRLGAAELTVNRRQLDPLDRKAVELIRQGLAEQAMRLYRDGGRITVARTAVEAHTAMTADWWESFSSGESAVMLAFRRVEVDRLNDLARQLMAADGRLSGPALDNQGRAFQTGDRIVCGLNCPKLEVANGIRGRISAVDVDARTVTVITDDERQVVLPAAYLGKDLGKGRRPLDHAYAVTGHKSQGVTVDRVFVCGAGPNLEWSYVAGTRARHRADFYLVEAPALPDAADVLDLVPPASRDPYDVAIAALGRSMPQVMAIDAAAEAERPHPSTLSTTQLRQERDELVGLFAAAPRDQRRVHRRTVEQLDAVEAELAGVRARVSERESWLASHGRGLVGLARRDAVKAARADLANLRQQQVWLQEKLAGLEQRERQLARHERQRAAWDETHRADAERRREVAAELAWRSKARSTARTVDTPEWLADLLGPVPDSTRGHRGWRAAAEQAEAYRDRYDIDADALGERPMDLAQLREWRACHQMIDRLVERTRGRDQQREPDRGHTLEIG
jgi:conjugative relaxase-like TrwC/TraI family protein